MDKKKAITGRGSKIEIIDEFIKSDERECKHEWEYSATKSLNSPVPLNEKYICKKCKIERSPKYYSMRSDGVLIPNVIMNDPNLD